MVMNVPLTRAERLKIEHGSVVVQGDDQEEFIVLEDDPHFSGLEIDKIMLNQIINARVSETFQQLRERIMKNDDIEALGAGVFLTGGSSKLKEIDKLAEEIFSLPVSLASISTMSGATAPFENPQLATPMGLIRYAQMIEANKTEKTNPFKLFRKKLGGLFGGSTLIENNN